MTPYQRARKAHESDPDNFSFRYVVETHFSTGIVVSDRNVFLLARPVDLSENHAAFDFPDQEFDNPDCWHVYLAAGSLPAMLAAIPYPLPFVSFVRKNRLHVHGWKQIARGVTNLSHGRTTKTSEGTGAGE